ncbi:ATP synthase F1 subcomplex gamma subunit, partial [gut metagenome]
MLPYQKQMYRILSHLLSDESVRIDERYTAERKPANVALVPVSSNGSLCGAFNINVEKALNEAIASYLDKGLEKDNIIIYPLGRKIAEAAKRTGCRISGDYCDLSDRHLYGDVVRFAESLVHSYLSGELDRIEFIYNHGKSTSVQEIRTMTYLPFSYQETETPE